MPQAATVSTISVNWEGTTFIVILKRRGETSYGTCGRRREKRSMPFKSVLSVEAAAREPVTRELVPSDQTEMAF